ncbi:cytochrome o ubiquinol oxidase subunit III [Methylomonas sp. MgM2]
MISDSAPELTAPQESVSADKHFGLWLYLISDTVLFALLFAVYATMSRNYAGGPSGRDLFELGQVFLETWLLLCSTLTCGLAMLAWRNKRKRYLLFWLIGTFGLGLSFIGMELYEFGRLIGVGAGPDRSGFLSAFFTLVGTHGLHVTIGLIWLAVMLAQIQLKGMTAPVYCRLFRFSLFWHFLDLIWVGVFSMVYLAGAL